VNSGLNVAHAQLIYKKNLHLDASAIALIQIPQVQAERSGGRRVVGLNEFVTNAVFG
jgi:hypothetical protein